MLGAAAIGTQHGDFSAVRMLWSVIGLQLGLVIGHYFRSAGKVMKTTRVQLELPEPSMERLKALKDKTEAASYAELIKNSLHLYEAPIAEAESGNEKSRDRTERLYRKIF
jgi:hypothetical protein